MDKDTRYFAEALANARKPNAEAPSVIYCARSAYGSMRAQYPQEKYPSLEIYVREDLVSSEVLVSNGAEVWRDAARLAKSMLSFRNSIAFAHHGTRMVSDRLCPDCDGPLGLCIENIGHDGRADVTVECGVCRGTPLARKGVHFAAPAFVGEFALFVAKLRTRPAARPHLGTKGDGVPGDSGDSGDLGGSGRPPDSESASGGGS